MKIAASNGAGRSTLHQKVTLVDDRTATIGSGNATKNSRIRCLEMTVKTNEPSTITSVKARFMALWPKATVLTQEAADALAAERAPRSRSSSMSRSGSLEPSRGTSVDTFATQLPG